MRNAFLSLLIAANSYSAVYTFDEFCNEVSKNNIAVIEATGERIVAKYEKESAMSFEPLNIELNNRKIKTDDSKNEQETSSMLGFSTKMPWLRASERKSYEAKENGLYIYEQLQKTLLKSSIKKIYLLFLLSQEEEAIYTNKEAAASNSYVMAKKKFEAGRISNMELTKFETELMQSRVDLASATAMKEEYHHMLSHAILSHDDIFIKDLKFSFYANLKKRLGELAQESLQIKELASKKTEIENEIGMYRYAFIDKVEFGIGYTKEPAQKSVDFRASFPLNITGKNESKVAALRTKLNTVLQKQKVLKDTLSIMADMEERRITDLEKKIKTSISNEQLYKNVFEMTTKGYEGGAVSLFEHIAAKNAYFDATIKTISYKKEYIEEIAKLENVFAGVIQ